MLYELTELFHSFSLLDVIDMKRGSYKGQQFLCLICQKEDIPQARVTRNAKKDNWVQCDCCKAWLHACCGGITQVQYSKVNKDTCWYKCVVCCLQQLNILPCDSEVDTPVNLVSVAVTRRLTAVTNLNKEKLKRVSVSSVYTPEVSTVSTPEVKHITSEAEVSQLSSSLLQSRPEHLVTNSANCTNKDSIPHRKEEDSITFSSESDLDKIVIIDKISNPLEFASTKRILREIHDYFPDVRVNYAYSLARGGVAVHTISQSDRDLLINDLPAESFGGGVKHLPKGYTGEWIFIKGVDTSVESQCLIDKLQSQGIDIIEIKRLTKRYIGTPTQVVKVKSKGSSIERLLNINLVINNKRCTVERERTNKVIRCYHCQSFGHLARHCTQARHCEVCGDSHDQSERCSGRIQCCNCGGSHSAASNRCPAYRSRYEDITK